jgi:uncharacterized membrane protein
MSLRDGARWLLGLFLVVAGTAHFLATEEFLGQTPTWLPARGFIVYASGVVEILLGVALWFVRSRRRELGWVVAAFFVAVFPGNVHQALTGSDAFGLDTPAARWGRLAFQPLLILWALWATRPADPAAARSEAPPARPPDR